MPCPLQVILGVFVMTLYIRFSRLPHPCELFYQTHPAMFSRVRRGYRLSTTTVHRQRYPELNHRCFSLSSSSCLPLHSSASTLSTELSTIRHFLTNIAPISSLISLSACVSYSSEVLLASRIIHGVFTLIIVSMSYMLRQVRNLPKVEH